MELLWEDDDGHWRNCAGMDEDKRHERGVGLILSKDATQSLLEWEPVSERVIRARFNSRWRQVTVIQCYAPTNEASEETKENFYEELQAVLSRCQVGMLRL